MTRPSDHYPRRCGCGHHAADPLDTITLGPGRVVPLDEVIRQILNDHPISLRDDLDALKAGLGIPDAAPTVEADTPTRAGIGVEDATTPAPSTSDDYVSVSISLSGDRELVELVAALVIGGVK